MKLLKKILMTFIWIILILLVTFNVYNFVSIKILHKELPKIFGYSVLEVVSGSMEPTIMVGDLIVIDTDCEEYKKGDIITFRDVNGSFVTHRILEIGVDEMITKGDNNDSQDDAMSPATIVGKYVTRIPQLGSVMSSLKNPLVMALILAIGIIVCFLVSTDKDLKPKLTDEEKEFLEFKKFKEEEKKKTEKLVEKVVEESSSKETNQEELTSLAGKVTNDLKKTENNKKVVQKKNTKKNYNNNNYRKEASNNNRSSNKNATNNRYSSQKNKTNNSARFNGQGNNSNARRNYKQYNKKANNTNRAQVNSKKQQNKNYNTQNKKKQQKSTDNK